MMIVSESIVLFRYISRLVRSQMQADAVHWRRAADDRFVS